MAPLYAVRSEYHEDDYKRARSTSNLVGVFSSRERAEKVAILRLIAAMKEHIKENGTPEGDPIAKRVRKFCETCKGDAFDVSKGLNKAQNLIENVYGEPEFGDESSGVRYYVKEFAAVDQIIKGEVLAEDFNKNWVDEISGVKSYTKSAKDGADFGESDEEADEDEDSEDSEGSEEDEGAKEGAPAKRVKRG